MMRRMHSRRSSLLALLTLAALLATLFPASVPRVEAYDGPVFPFDARRAFGPSAGNTGALALGDVNGDHEIDIVIGKGGGLSGTEVYLNKGGGSFGARADQQYDTGGADITDLALGDVDGDGDLDVVTSEGRVWRNDGRGALSFSAPPIGTGAGGLRVALADVDGDADLDLATSDGLVYMNNGGGDFSEDRAARIGTDSATVSWVSFGDLDQDGDPDLVTGEGAVYSNDGAGGFPTAGRQPLGAGNPVGRMLLADLNGDGALDIVAETEGASGEALTLYINDRRGRFPTLFSREVEGTAGITTVALGDVDGDGDQDILAGSFGQELVLQNDGTGSFPAQDRLQFGTENDTTLHVAIADLNGDGHLDAAVASGAYYQNLIYFNEGAGTYALPHLVPRPFGTTFERISDLTLGDLNGDGAADLIAARYGVFSTLYLNDGTGGYPYANERPLNDERAPTTSAAVGDLDGDGHLDVVLGNYGRQSFIYMNSGDATFPEERRIPLGSGTEQTWRIAVCDVDGDGDLDILTGNDEGPSYIYQNDGSGNFSRDLLPPFGSDTDVLWDLAVADINGDGAPDILEALGQEGLVAYRNDGNGVFAAGAQLTGVEAGFASQVVAGDLDGDDLIDVVVGYSDAFDTIYRNDGSGGFSPAGEIPPDPLSSDSPDGTSSIAIGDVNGDGSLDLALGRDRVADKVYINDGYGRFVASPGSQYDLGDTISTATSVAIGDVSGDGVSDIVVGNNVGQSASWVSRMLSPNRIPFGRAAFVAAHPAPADVDGDGDLDLVVAQWTQDGDPIPAQSSVFINDGTGMFPERDVRPFGDAANNARDVVVGDVDNDGDLDLIARHEDRQIILHENDGTGRFPATGQRPIAPASVDALIRLADMDNDSDLDLVVAEQNYDAGTTSLVIYPNAGDGGYPTGAAQRFGDRLGDTTAIAINDVDSDGDLDLIIGNRLQSGVYRNDGSGRFGDSAWEPFGEAERVTLGLALGDVNGDGSLDIVTGNYGQQNVIYLNDGSGRFSGSLPRLFGAVTDITTSIALGDIDGDGDLDILAGNGDCMHGANSAVYLNSGLDSFPVGSSRTLEGSYAMVASLADLDGDGAPDIVLGNCGTQSTTVINRRARADALPNTPPLVHVRRPGSVPDATLHSTAEILTSSSIPITYTLTDDEGDEVQSIRALFSLDGGANWLPAIPASGTRTADLNASPQGSTHTFFWDTFASGFFGQSDNVVLRIIAYPGVLPIPWGVAGSAQCKLQRRNRHNSRIKTGIPVPLVGVPPSVCYHRKQMMATTQKGGGQDAEVHGSGNYSLPSSEGLDQDRDRTVHRPSPRHHRSGAERTH